ncbi:GH25 family lysozyme [Streptomyces sp. SS7]|uniref:GH25 family lysozyme n=1 Tax=Streptomyces sp. SS7 TaxID=3108485 RepID=UPI0030EDE937
MSGLIKGIDVASHQSSTYDLTGVDFVFVKATEGTWYTNPKMAAQVSRARSAGVVVGFYHFLRKGGAQAQAAYFVSKAEARPGEILACDWESAPDGSAPSSEEKDAFIREVARLAPGRRVVLYCNRDYWLNRDRSSYAGHGLWIADPSAPMGAPRITHPWLFHQYSISGGMDRDVAAFPTRAALKDWAAGDAPASPPGETDMALTAAQTYDAVWKTDKAPAPKDAPDVKTNPTWQPVSILADTQAQARALRKDVAALAAELTAVRLMVAAQGEALRAQGAAQAEALPALRGQLDALTAGLSQLDVSGVLAELQRRLSAVRVELTAEEVTT